MSSSKTAAVLFLLLFTAGIAVTQESFSDFTSGGFSGSSSGESGFSDASGDSSDFGGSFGDFSSNSGEDNQESNLEIGGSTVFQTRYYINSETSADIEDSEIESFPEVNLDLKYRGENSDFKADLVFSRDNMYSDYENVINEAYLSIYYDSFNMEAGFMKVVWGKGDELKAVDILNPIDYSDFYNKDLLDRKIASPMIKINKYTGLNGLFEIVYIPYTSYPEFDDAVSGRWASYEIKTLGTLSEAGLTDVSYKNNEALYSSQAALRYTNSTEGFDYGLVYSYGFMPMPTIKLDSFSGTIPGTAEIEMERANIFGLEAAKVILGLNSRAELAYYMSSDIKGDDPDIQNNEIMWVFGFDKDLPVSSMNLLVETQGTYILNNSEIKEISASSPDYDVDYDSDGTYSRNIIIAKLKDSFNHDRIRPELSFIYHVEDQDFMLRPEAEFILKDDISFDILYTYFYGDEDTIFGAYEENSFLQAKFVYSF